jgi:hypothetical protein
LFDYRYHALSLAAVLFALVVGLLIGIAIGDSSLVSSAKSGIVHDLSSELNETRHRQEALQSKLSEEESFTGELYPLAVHDLLARRTFGLLFLGSSSDDINRLAGAALQEAGGTIATVATLREPLDLEGIDTAAAGTHFSDLTRSLTSLELFGQLIGRQLVKGGTETSRELLTRVRTPLLSAFDGQLTRLEGLIVMRSEPPHMTGRQSEATAALQSGLLSGVAAEGVPTVGVQLTATEPSQVPWYKGQHISSVDDLDTTAGQAALIYALDGSPGAYGTRSTANSLLPSVPTAAPQP